MNKIFKVSAVLYLSLLLCLPAKAANVVTPDPSNSNSNVVIGSSDVHKNLYTAGANVTINADTKGDLTVAGGQVTVEGKIEQELLAAGGSIYINGSTGGHVRAVGGNITINAPVGGDVVVAGGNINITAKSAIAGDAMIAGGNVVLEAPVKGNLNLAGGNITINSKVDGDVYIKAGQTLNFGPQAEIKNTIHYWSPKAATVDPGAKLGQMSFTQVEASTYKNQVIAIFTFAFLIKILAWMLFGWLIIRFRKTYLNEIVVQIKSQPWHSFGWGLGTIILVPVVCVLLLLTFVGYYLSIVAGLSFALLLAVCAVVGSLMLGYLILGWLVKGYQQNQDWQALVLGVVVWSLLGFVPIIGGLVKAVIFILTFGSMVKKLKESFNN